MARKRLQRSNDAVLGGVCAGIAEYFGISAVTVRVLTVVLAVLTLGAILPIYLVLWAMTPRCPMDYAAYVDVAPENARCSGAAGTAAAKTSDAAQVRLQDEGDVKDSGGATSARASSASASRRDAGHDSGHVRRARSSRAMGRSRLSRQASSGSGASFAIAAGIVLVAAGIVGVASRIVGGRELWSAWPATIIVLGIYVIVLGARSDKNTGASVFDGILITVLGVLMLVCSLGVVPWSLVSYITALWPVFLVALGIALAALGLRSKGMRVVAAVVSICALAVGVANSYCGGDMLVGTVAPRQADARISSIAEIQPAASASLADAGDVTVDLTGGASTLTVDAADEGSDAALYLTTDVRRPSAVEYDAERALLTVTAGSGVLSGPCDVELPQGHTYSRVIVDANGSSRLNMDLTGLTVTGLSLETGITNTELTLSRPASGGSTASIHAGTSDLTLNVPEDVHVRITTDYGCRLNLPVGYTVTSYGSRQVITNFGYGDDVANDAGGWASSSSAYDVWDIDERGNLGSLVVRNSDDESR